MEEEQATRDRLRKFTIIYIPVYAVFSLVIYVLEILFFSKDDTSADQQNLIIVYAICNLVKLVCETFIGVTTFKFAASIKKLISLVIYEFGEAFS
jgi:multidrug transporter EmrE-like cation transporter